MTTSEDRQRRADWAAKINDQWQKSVQGILQCATFLAQALADLGDAEFGEMVEHELLFGRRSAQRLLFISTDRHRLATHVSQLPPSWGTLHALAHLPDDVFAAAVADGRIHPDMTRAEAQQLMPSRPERPTPVTTRVFVSETPTPSEPPRPVLVEIDHDVAGPPEAFCPVEQQYGAAEIAGALAVLDHCDSAALTHLVRDNPSIGGKARRVIETLRRAIGDDNTLLH